MLCWLILISLFGFTASQIVAYNFFQRCSYTGDPHVIPFTPAGTVPKMYFCQRPGWEVVLRNQWVLILVRVGPIPWVILDHIVIFFKSDGSIACLLIGSLGISTCPIGSPVTTSIGPGGTSWTHSYHPATSQYLFVHISSFLWGIGKRYDFNIRQTSNLYSQSTGVCVKPNCPLEQILAPPPIIINICKIYINAAQQRLTGRFDQIIGGLITTACQNDLKTSFVTKLAQTAVVNLIYRDLDLTNSQDYPAAIARADVKIQEAIAEADAAAARLLAQGGTCSAEQRCLTNDG